VQEKRQAAERRLGAAPLIGKRLVISGYGQKPARPVTGEQPEPYLAEAHWEPEPLSEATDLQPEVVSVSASHLWQALCWTVPLVAASAQPYTPNETFLKIAWKPVSPALSELQCIWADGKRYSQAAIPGHASAIQQAWTITLGSRAVTQLTEFLQRSASEDTDLLVWRQFSPSRLCAIPVLHASRVPFAVPCMPAVLPGAVPPLRPPLSQIIIEQEQLFLGLTALQQNWEARNPVASSPATIELVFGNVSALQLSIGPIEEALVISIPGMDGLLVGPEIRLRLDFAALEHIIASAQGTVQRWQLRIGRDAEMVQFLPEFDPLSPWTDALAWRHELRDVAVG